MKPAALLVFLTDINAIGLDTAQGLYLTAAWYWDLDDKSREFAKRFFAKVNREPTFPQAAYYSATLTYLNAVKAAGATDADKVMDELHKTKIDDMFAERRHPPRRPDGTRHVHHAGQDAGGIEGPVGLLQARRDDEGRRGVRQTRRFRLPAGQEIAAAPRRVAGAAVSPSRPRGQTQSA